ncbi:MAG: cyclodeaminase/cyclohydrolase family protein [Thermoplasmata archaeon]|nr:MAG: cyclodeaminase/cyclohydrolase family protein [Thermoplasmata archaeon]
MPKEASFEFMLNEISSKSPAPGGGSVSALSGCFGAALVSMVCNLSIGKKRFVDVENELKEILSETKILKSELFDLSRKDIEAFNEVMVALKISDKEAKKENLQKAYKEAALVPLEVAERCLRVMELAQITIIKGNQNAVTDSGVAALMAHAGLKGAVLNVKVNLISIEDEQFNLEKKAKIEDLESKAEHLLGMIFEKVEDSLST